MSSSEKKYEGPLEDDVLQILMKIIRNNEKYSESDEILKRGTPNQPSHAVEKHNEVRSSAKQQS